MYMESFPQQFHLQFRFVFQCSNWMVIRCVNIKQQQIVLSRASKYFLGWFVMLTRSDLVRSESQVMVTSGRTEEILPSLETILFGFYVNGHTRSHRTLDRHIQMGWLPNCYKLNLGLFIRSHTVSEPSQLVMWRELGQAKLASRKALGSLIIILTHDQAPRVHSSKVSLEMKILWTKVT